MRRRSWEMTARGLSRNNITGVVSIELWFEKEPLRRIVLRLSRDEAAVFADALVRLNALPLDPTETAVR